jgi:hypothetical protein
MVGVAMVPQAAGSRAALITFADNGTQPDSVIVTGTGEDLKTATATGVQLSTPGPGEAPVASATIAPTAGGGTVQFEVGGSPVGAPVPRRSRHLSAAPHLDDARRRHGRLLRLPRPRSQHRDRGSSRGDHQRHPGVRGQPDVHHRLER